MYRLICLDCFIYLLLFFILSFTTRSWIPFWESSVKIIRCKHTGIMYYCLLSVTLNVITAAASDTRMEHESHHISRSNYIIWNISQQNEAPLFQHHHRLPAGVRGEACSSHGWWHINSCKYEKQLSSSPSLRPWSSVWRVWQLCDPRLRPGKILPYLEGPGKASIPTLWIELHATAATLPLAALCCTATPALISVLTLRKLRQGGG